MAGVTTVGAMSGERVAGSAGSGRAMLRWPIVVSPARHRWSGLLGVAASARLPLRTHTLTGLIVEPVGLVAGCLLGQHGLWSITSPEAEDLRTIVDT